MTILVTGSAGHLGEAVLRMLRGRGFPARGIDLKPSPFTDAVGSIVDPDFVRRQMDGVTAVIHTATLHKPHVATHGKQDFVDTNVTGTLNLLEAAVAAGVKSFVFTSTTSAFGSQLRPEAGQAAVWVTEDLPPVPKNIYGTTKLMAENLCELFFRERGLPVVVLRTSRFFPEDDDDPAMRSAYARRTRRPTSCSIAGWISRTRSAPICSPRRARRRSASPATSSRRPARSSNVISRRWHATRPVSCASSIRIVRSSMPRAAGGCSPRSTASMSTTRARRELGWRPEFDFAHVLRSLREGRDFRSTLAREVGAKGYHDTHFRRWPYPVAP